jgi:benzoylformate decarboxylase
MTSTTVRLATIDLLRTLGMTTVFGNPGSTELAFLQDWPDDFRYVLGLQESAVVGMADGYAQATGSAAFVNLHSAAGVGHALGSVFTAFRNRTPLVIAAGQQVRELMPLRPFLGATHAPVFPQPYVKWSCEPARAADVPLAIAQAHCIAMQKPWGPTFVSVPADDWWQPAVPVPLHPKSREFAPELVMVGALADAINACQRPALVIGAGVARDQASKLVIELAETMQAAVWSEPLASRSAFPETHTLFAGILPAAPEAIARILGAHDLVLVLGAPAFMFHVSGDLQRIRAIGPVYQVTDEPELAATALSATSILGSTRFAVAALLERVVSKPQRVGCTRERAERFAPTDPIQAAFVMQTIAELRQQDSVIVEEAPSHKLVLQRHLPIHNNGFYAMASGGLGYGLAAAVGVALADPSRHVICIVGDGSAMYSIQALWTAAQHQLPITYVVLNNGGYGAMRAFSEHMKSKNLPGMDLPLLDFVALARGQGCDACRVTRAADLASTLKGSLAAKLPTLVEVVLDRAFQPLFRAD